MIRTRLREAWHALRGYSAAQDARASTWAPSGGSANSEVGNAAPTIARRARDAVRNDPYAARIVDLWTGNAVGAGITARWPDKRRADAWRRWADSTNCDAEGCLDLYGLQALIMRAVVESGECLVRLITTELTPGNPIGLRLQVLESDHLDASRTGVADGMATVQGITLDTTGAPVAYWLFPQYPGASWYLPCSSQSSTPVPATALLLAHVVLHDRVATGEPVLVAQTIKQPLGCVTMLARTANIFDQPLIDDLTEPVQLRPADWRRPPIPGRNRKPHDLPHAVARDPKLTRRLSPAHAITARKADLPIQLHGENAPPSLKTERAKLDDFYAARSEPIPPLPWQTFPPPLTKASVGSRPIANCRSSRPPWPPMAPGTPSSQCLHGRAPQPNVQTQRRSIAQFQQRSGHPRQLAE